MTTPSRDPKIEPHPSVGLVFEMKRFDESDKDGVALGCQITGPQDFPSGGYKHWLENGRQKVRIEKSATSNGDAGICRHFSVRPGEEYRLTAKVQLLAKSGQAKARVNMAAQRKDNSQVKEFNANPLEVIAPKAAIRTARALIPDGTQSLSVRVKFHTDKPGEFCEGEIYSMKLERLS
jgi:hypothetical protein